MQAQGLLNIRPWSFVDTVTRFGAVEELAEKYGYLASIFGGTVSRGAGRDLDILMTPRREMIATRDGFLAAFGGEEVHRNVDESKGIWSIELARNGRIYDFVFGTVGKPRGTE
jgi:hypothetical protein